MGLLQDLFGDDDAAIAEGIYRKLEAIHTDIRRLAFVLSTGERKIMADIDTLNAGIAALQADENQEDTELAQLEALGLELQQSISTLQASSPSLTGAIAAVTALKAQNDARLAKLQADLAAGTTLEGTLPQPPAAAPAPAPATGTPPASS